MTEERRLVPPSAPTEVLLPTYPMLQRSGMEETLALIDDNLGQQGFNILNLSRIRVPAGGGLNWRVETASGEASLKEIEGLAVAWRPARLYFHKAFGRGGKKPPDCTSTNGFVGIGDPGGVCADCPKARFGSAINADGSAGGGQACKQVVQVLLVMPDEILPHLVNIPPTSVKPFNQFVMQLLSAKIPYWGTTVRLALEKATNETGIEYAKVSFRLGRRLSAAEQQILKPYHLRMKEILTPAVVDASAYEILEDEPEPVAAEPPVSISPVSPPPEDKDIPF